MTRPVERALTLLCLSLPCLILSSPGDCLGKGDEKEMKPPIARVSAVKLEKHGDVRVDEYYWMREREDPEVVEYLNAENAYTDYMMRHTEALQDALFGEFKTRIKQTDVTVPCRQDDYFYYSRTEEGREYPIYCRKKGSLEAPEEVMIDANKLAEGHAFCAVGQRAVSSGQDILAFSVDYAGRRFYSVLFKNLVTGEMLGDSIPDVTGNIAWANDNKTLFYTRQDPVTLRWHQIYRHVLGTDPRQDELVYDEKDESFGCSVS